MPGSFSAERQASQRRGRTRLAYRVLALPFTVIALSALAAFGEAIVAVREVRPPYLMFGILMGTTAVGLWLVAGWGRLLALIITIGNAGLGALLLFASAAGQDVSPLGPALLLAVNGAVAYALTRPIFAPVGRDG